KPRRRKERQQKDSFATLRLGVKPWLASRASRRPAMPLPRTAGPPSRFIAPACRRRAAFPDPQFWLPEIPVAWTSQSSAPFGNNGPRRQVGHSPRPLVPACRLRLRSPAPALRPAALRKARPAHSFHLGDLPLFVHGAAPPPAEFRNVRRIRTRHSR